MGPEIETKSMTYDFDVVSMKVRFPDSDAIFEMSMNPPPKIPITIDDVRYNSLVNMLETYITTLYIDGNHTIAGQLDKIVSVFQ